MTILIFLAVLVVLILVHEFGHFIVAKKSGIRVDEFGIGFPPKAVGKKYGETEYTLNWLPIGGFVRIWGEDPTEEHYENGPDSERSFVKKPRHIQAAVLVAGVAMNVLLAFVLYVAAYMIGMPTSIPESQVATVSDPHLLVTEVLPETPAAEILKPNDKIERAYTAESELLPTADSLMPSEVSQFITTTQGAEITFDIIRRDENMTVSIQPATGIIPDNPERFAVGFSMMLVGIEQLPVHTAILTGAVRTYNTLGDILDGLGGLLAGIFKGTSDLSQVAGPVGIVGLVGDAASLGITWLLIFTAFISLNLAIINLLPIPALDGGRLVFVAIEAITRKPIKPIVAVRANQFGMIALLLLMAVVTVNDVWRIFG